MKCIFFFWGMWVGVCDNEMKTMFCSTYTSMVCNGGEEKAKTILQLNTLFVVCDKCFVLLGIL